MKLCDYGCGQEATHQLKNGKWCCKNSSKSCKKIIEKSVTSRRRPKREKPDLCDYGCGQESKFKFANGKWCCSDSYHRCQTSRKKSSISHTGHKDSEETRNKKSLSLKGRISPMKGKQHKPESLKILHEKFIGREKGISWEDKYGIEKSNKLKEDKSKLMKYKISDPNSKYNTKDHREKCRQRMLKGDAIKMIKCIKKISNEEIKLREIVKEIYPNCEFQYGVFNYSLDVAIPEHKIAIEYDGYYHFDKPEKIEYYDYRRKRIESQGWKFLRYTMFDKFPTLEEIKENILKLLPEQKIEKPIFEK